ncbi:MAG TPA: class I SAM-dependent methyltransferase [Gammaproteobacteria bacterium]
MTVDHDHVRRFYDLEYYGADRASTASWHTKRVAGQLGDLRGKAVLDVACGAGEWLEELARRGARTAGVDISAVGIERCRNRVPDAELFCCAAEELPFDDNIFDIVTCLGSLEHFLDERRALLEMCRVARQDGQILLLVPNAGFLTRRLGLYQGTEQTVVKEDVKSLVEWEELFSSVGLRVAERWRDLHVLSRSWIGRGAWPNWPLRLLQAIALPLWPLPWQYQVYYLCRIEGCVREIDQGK